MNEKNQFDVNPEYMVNSAIDENNVPDCLDADAKEAVIPVENSEQKADDCISDEQSAERNSHTIAPSVDPAIFQQEDVATDKVGFELEKISSDIAESAEISKKIFAEIREIHKLYHNEFAGRLKSMQDELDTYHKAERGRAFDDILSAIARIYGNNETLVDEIADSKTQKHVKYMLLDILDLLEEYGVQRLKSNLGDKRNTRHCQVLERIPTDDPALHDTIVASHNSGFYKENRTIIKEMVDIYVYEQPITVEIEESTPLCNVDDTSIELDN
ncbi:MAG: nucleotide exchange factor GrpE [Ruminococcus sp.]|nr:nucleotide exchange factor GrpE [Ruminococcus sp.]